MEVLKQARGHIKGSVTRLHNFAQNIPADTETVALEIRLERLEESWKDFCRNQTELFQFHADAGYVDPEPDFEVVEGKYLSAKCAIVKAIKNSNQPPARDEAWNVTPATQQVPLLENLDKSASQSADKKTDSDLSLPVLQLPPFSGDYRDWPGFRDMFLRNIDCNSRLSGASKFQYLKSYLGVEPLKLLNNLTTSDSIYEEAWEKLERRYDKPLSIINAYIESFLKLPNVSSGDHVQLRKLVDSADEVLRGLSSLKAEGRDPWLVYLLLGKLDADSRQAWALENKGSEDATIKSLIQLLEDRCNALESSEPKARVYKNPRNHSNIKSLNVIKSSYPKCKEPHSLPQCTVFLSMSVSSRRIFARDQRLCYNCLGTNHSSVRCRVKARCSICNARHHSLVHPEDNDRARANNREDAPAETGPSTSGASTSVVCHHIKNGSRSSGILPTVIVRVLDASGGCHFARVLLDTGSQVSFVTENLVKKLGLRRRHARLPISGISSFEAGVTQGAVTLTLNSRFDTNSIEIDAYVLKTITSLTPSFAFDRSNIEFLEHLPLADSDFATPGPVDILLGADKAWSILRNGHRTDRGENVVAHETIFGWVVTGKISESNIVSLHVGIDLDVLLKSFWEIEELPHRLSLSHEEDEVDAHFSQTFARSSDHKYMVELPFRQEIVSFGNTISGALAMLFAMERRLARNENLRVEYCKFMKAYEDLGHMERIPDHEVEPTSGSVFYLPHHAVVTNKLRVVFNGSHKDTNGVSLNDMLHIGTPLQRNLIKVSIRFRLYKYVFSADIVKMFRQIWVHPQHRNFQRIVWRPTPQDPVAHYRLCTVTYGTSSAPYLSIKVVRQLALDYRHKFPLASHAILEEMYVDDILTGSDSIDKTLELQRQLVDMLALGGLELSKWSSNCWQILRDTECEERLCMDLNSASPCTKVLGLIWSPHSDNFTFKIALDDQLLLPTKRKLLSEVAKIFDPMGFLAPSTILFKMLFQELWVAEAKIGWDDSLPSDIATKWKSYRSDLSYFEKLRISRRFTLNSQRFELIGFSDASEKAYSAVVYSRSFSEDGALEIQLVAAKTRVAPVKQLSIPKLELCGALLLSRLVEVIRSSVDVNPVHVYTFCDSKIVLNWLSSPPKRWNTFVANRTAEILDILPRSSWNHVCSAENPADCASRGVEPKRLLELDIWWKGPVWLQQDIDQWPMNHSFQMENVPEERKRLIVVHFSSSTEHFVERLAAKTSSLLTLLRIIAFVLRFVRNCRVPSCDRTYGYVRFEEYHLAKETCVRWSQGEFKTEIYALKGGRHVLRGSKLSSLSPFLDDKGLLRVGGRIANAQHVPFATKHPIILPKDNRLTQLILKDAHHKFLHVGVSGLFALIRQEYWILGSRNLIRKIVFECPVCFVLRQSTTSQIMGNLPSSRVDPSFAFAHTGCDYAGPITLRLSKGRNPKFVKGYIALFVCMATKAVHLEMVSDLTTDAFLAALKRFVARRGKCSVIHSDNGTNFQGAARVLSELSKLVRSKNHNEKVADTLAAESIRWEFIPPHSPHFGGLWEAGVKLVKQHLRRVVGHNILTFEEMCTLLAQIEALLNSRPLCAISDTDLNPLTPSHFLIGRPYVAIAEPSYLEVQSNRLSRWELIQNMMQGFWRRWQTDYLTSLQQRPKWREATREVRVGDLVVVKEPNLPPSKWSLGRVEEVHPGNDGHVRVVTLRTSSGVFKRPIVKLAVLPSS